LKKGESRFNCFHITELGINVIINEMYKGLMYKEVYDDAFTSEIACEVIKWFVLIMMCIASSRLSKYRTECWESSGWVRASRGFLALTDNSHPEDIKTVLKMSKKTFKESDRCFVPREINRDQGRRNLLG
jgi:hypothetical protein